MSKAPTSRPLSSNLDRKGAVVHGAPVANRSLTVAARELYGSRIPLHRRRPGRDSSVPIYSYERTLHRTSSAPWQINSFADAGALARNRASTAIIWPGQQ